MTALLGSPKSALDMSVIEENAVALGVSLGELMENAGRAIAEDASRHLPPAPARVAVVAGSGNNGGDGTCAAFYLQQWGYSPEVWLVRPASEIRSSAARRCWERAHARMPSHDRSPRAAELSAVPLVIDAMLGTGQGGELRSPYREACEEIRASGAPVLSVDLPTGMGSDGALRPRWTVTFTEKKAGMTEASCGEVTVRSVGIPETAWSETGPGEFRFLSTGAPRGSRSRRGRIAVVGGGPYSGAPALAALAALRTGCERASVLAPWPAADRIQGFSADLVVTAVGDGEFHLSDVALLTERLSTNPPDALVLGMGAGADSGTCEAFSEVIARFRGKIPLVVDADALAAIPPRSSSGTPGDLIATPNAGEYRRVFGATAPSEEGDRLEEARRIASERGITLVVKGEPDLLTDGRFAFVNRRHAPAQTVAGAGDVLAGTLGGLLGQGLPATGAVRLATFWVGEAGVRAAARIGPGLLASEILPELSMVRLERDRKGTAL
ncbi:MAG: NAD(P)H-hydrate dehydratase [Thermoplasmata archaeon]|nr:NAD(P)H-hydrate dehydratase [Thermoplasmata archaeon]